MLYTKQKGLLILFITTALGLHWYGCSQESEERGKRQAEAVNSPPAFTNEDIKTQSETVQVTTASIGELRKPNKSLKIIDLPPSPLSYQLVRIYPDISLRKITFIIDSTMQDRLFIGQKSGEIYTFSKTEHSQSSGLEMFLDIQHKVADDGEMGLLGMAVDPNFSDNGTFYVFYSSLPNDSETYGPSILSRFKTTEHSRTTVDPDSEEIILKIPQYGRNHKGGAIIFGPDNMLYVSIGDDEPPRNDVRNSQDTTNLKGAILRIDVRTEPDPLSNKNYVVPLDNPYSGQSSTSGLKKEIFAYGFRNVWRFSFDKQSGAIYAADVGLKRFEEINHVIPGGNYGWPIYEGNYLYEGNYYLSRPEKRQNYDHMLPPIAEYSHVENGTGGRAAIVGGYVYHGSRMPELQGMYIFGDNASGKIYGVMISGENAPDIVTLVDSELRIYGFYQDSEGEIYAYGRNPGIYAIRRQSYNPNSNFPEKLSELASLHRAGLGQAHLRDGIIPYAPNSQLWSDGALKERLFALPDYDYNGPPYAQIDYRKNGAWDFPNHTVIIKNFLLPLDFRTPQASAKRIETRLLVKNAGKWYGFSYKWNEEETDAVLLESAKKRNFTIIEKNGERVDYQWHYPSRSECMQCHTKGSNYLLGLNTAQMNHSFHYTDADIVKNQLQMHEEFHLFMDGLPDAPENLPRMPDPYNATAPIYLRARAYLSANCSQCHQPRGTAVTARLVDGELNFLWEATETEMNVINADLHAYNNPDISGMKRIKPFDPEHSMVHFRMATLDSAYRMPPLATSRVDGDGVDLIAKWIDGLDYRQMGEFSLFFFYPSVAVKKGTWITSITAGGDRRISIFMRSPAEIQFPPIAVQAGDYLAFGIGTHRRTWEKPGDGMELSILLSRDPGPTTKPEQPVLIYSKYLDPKKNPDERKWFDERISLGEYANSNVRITLKTGSGPRGDGQFDQAVWSVLKVSSDSAQTP